MSLSECMSFLSCQRHILHKPTSAGIISLPFFASVFFDESCGFCWCSDVLAQVTSLRRVRAKAACCFSRVWALNSMPLLEHYADYAAVTWVGPYFGLCWIILMWVKGIRNSCRWTCVYSRVFSSKADKAGTRSTWPRQSCKKRLGMAWYTRPLSYCC